MILSRRALIAILAPVVFAAALAGCAPGPPPPPGPSCAGTPVEAAIRNNFAGADENGALQIAYRESRCAPGARNPSGASGLFQLELPLHADLFNGVCLAGAYAWDNPYCNAAAARRLYNDEGGWLPAWRSTA